MELNRASAVAFFFLLLTHSLCLHVHGFRATSYHHDQGRVDQSLPRKLKLTEFAANFYPKYEEIPPFSKGAMYGKGGGRKQKKRGGEEEEEDRMSEYVGMDYSRVRRRRPVHNKFNPKAAP